MFAGTHQSSEHGLPPTLSHVSVDQQSVADIAHSPQWPLKVGVLWKSRRCCGSEAALWPLLGSTLTRPEHSGSHLRLHTGTVPSVIISVCNSCFKIRVC